MASGRDSDATRVRRTPTESSDPGGSVDTGTVELPGAAVDVGPTDVVAAKPGSSEEHATDTRPSTATTTAKAAATRERTKRR